MTVRKTVEVRRKSGLELHLASAKKAKNLHGESSKLNVEGLLSDLKRVVDTYAYGLHPRPLTNLLVNLRLRTLLPHSKTK